MPDDHIYVVTSITEAFSGVSFGVNLDQPITANLRVVAVSLGPPSETAPERSLRVRERDPELGSDLPPARRRRQHREGDEGVGS